MSEDKVQKAWETLRRQLIDAGAKIAEDAPPMLFAKLLELPEWSKVDQAAQIDYGEAVNWGRQEGFKVTKPRKRRRQTGRKP